MSNQEESNNNMDRHWLDALIRRSGKHSDPEAELPSEAVILDYLTGDASDEDIRSVKHALLHSAVFRKTLMERSKEMATFVEATEAAEFKNMKVPEAPPEIKKNFAEISGTSAPGFAESKSIWDSLRPYFALPRLAPVAIGVAALGLLVFIMQPDQQDQTAQFTKNHFMTFSSVRSLSREKIDTTFATEFDAALFSFQSLVKYNERTNKYEFLNQSDSDTTQIQIGNTLRFTDNTSSAELQYSLTDQGIKLASAGTSQSQAWFLSVPQLVLETIPIIPEEMAYTLESMSLVRGCVTIVVKTDSGYQLLGGITFDFDSANK